MKILEQVDLAPLTTFKIGGKARYLARAASADDVRSGFEFAKSNDLPVLILGGGSNMLLSDSGFDGLILKIEIKGIEYDGERATVGAGEDWDAFVADTVSRGLWGIENLSGIPGTVGAAPVQNIGAYGTEVKSSIVSVDVFDPDTGAACTLSNAECAFEYRDSLFKKPQGSRLVILRVAFNLSKNAGPNISYKDLANHFGENRNPEIEEIRAAVLSIRSKKFPDLSEWGTAGSFWKNPIISKERFEELKNRFPLIQSYETKNGVKIPLAWILDNVLGLKGYSAGHASLFERQPLVLVARPGAKRDDVEKLAQDVEKKILGATGIEVEREVRCV